MGADYERVRTEIGDGSSKEQLVMTRLTRLQTKGSRGHMHKNRVSGSYQLFFSSSCLLVAVSIFHFYLFHVPTTAVSFFNY